VLYVINVWLLPKLPARLKHQRLVLLATPDLFYACVCARAEGLNCLNAAALSTDTPRLTFKLHNFRRTQVLIN
jgi:hypothetical protein